MTRRLFVGVAAAATLACLSAAPARADLCELSWDVPCCPVPGASYGVAMVTLTICNCTDEPAEYVFSMKSPIPGLEFGTPGGALFLQPGECVDIPINVYCPFGVPPIMGGYPIHANVTNLLTGAMFGCDGLVKPVSSWKIIANDPVIPAAPDPGTPIGIDLSISDLGGGVTGMGGVDVTFLAMGPIVPPPSTFFEVPQGSSTVVRIFAGYNPGGVGGTITEGGAPLTGALLILWDDDGDGAPEVNSSVNFRFTEAPCAGDINGDGVVNGADLAGLLANWGLCP